MNRLARLLAGAPQRLVVALVVVATLAVGCADSTPTGLAGIVREPAPDVSGAILSDGANGGADFTTVARAGHLLLVYFGFTFCPDICPTTLADTRKALRGLGDRAELVDFAMITIDPERDRPEGLTEYVQAFFEYGHALRTDDAERLRRVADAYGADYRVIKRDDGVVEVEHSAFLYVVDSRGRILVQWAFGTPSEDMTNDLAYLFDQGV
jgi:protein SCO1/2